MTLAEALAMRVDELLEEKKMTQYKLSMSSGVTQGSIGDIRHMRQKTHSLKMIYDIAQGFGPDLPEFFDSPLFRDGNITD